MFGVCNGDGVFSVTIEMGFVDITQLNFGIERVECVNVRPTEWKR